MIAKTNVRRSSKMAIVATREKVRHIFNMEMEPKYSQKMVSDFQVNA